MRFILTFFLIIYSVLSLHAQFVDDFSDGELNQNPTWLGDTQNFIVNNGQLQLNAPGAGSSFIYTETDFPDSIRWTIQLLMDFAPSSSNKQKVFLALDNLDLASANGYYIEIGENGSDDALNFYRLENGSESLMASGSMGAVGSDPAFANILIEKSSDQFWSIYVAYEENDFKELDFEFMETNNILPQSGYFGMECTYTVSRVEDFFYDDISLQLLLPDTEAPLYLSTELLTPTSFKITFDEFLDESSVNAVSNYNLSDIGNPSSIDFDPNVANEFTLNFDSPLQSGTIYFLDISGVQDVSGNEMIAVNDIELFLTEEAVAGDLLVNEILFDPYQEGEDFVEIYNASDKFISLNGIILSNDSKSNDTEVLSTDLVLKPQEYLAISPDIEFLIETYLPPSDAQLLEHDIPSFNNESGNVSIIVPSGGTDLYIDSFDYEEDQHYSLLNDTEGVSLERISFVLDANDPTNWQSAVSQVNYATPGYENSQRIGDIEPGTEVLTLLTKSFSPNQDGSDDLLVLPYNLEKTGYVADIKVYDANGYLIRNLYSNEFLGTQGILSWNGLNDGNELAPIGMYVIVYNFFHIEGEVKEGKLVGVLADFLN